MLDFHAEWINVTEHLRARQMPVFMLPRPFIRADDSIQPARFGQSEAARVGTFWVPQGSLLSKDCSWSVTCAGDYVRIPVIGYQAEQATCSPLLGFGLQLGILARDAVLRHTSAEVLSVLLVLGQAADEFRSLNQGYIGVALRTQ